MWRAHHLDRTLDIGFFDHHERDVGGHSNFRSLWAFGRGDGGEEAPARGLRARSGGRPGLSGRAPEDVDGHAGRAEGAERMPGPAAGS